MKSPKPKIDFLLLYPLTAALLALVVIPVAVAIIGSFLNIGLLGMTQGQLQGNGGALVSLEGFEYLLFNYRDWIVLSLALAILSVVGCLLLTVPAGYALVRYPFPASLLIEEICLLPLSLPGITMSIALLAAYNSMRGTWLVWGGHLLYTAPFMLRIVTGTLRSFDIVSMEQAAQSMGARLWQRFAFIVLPQLKHGTALGSLLVFAISWGEFNVSYLLNAGHPQTFPAALYNTYANESLQRSSAATVIFLSVIVPAVLAIQFLGGRSMQNIEQGV